MSETPHARIMSLLSEALKLAPAAGLYLEIRITEREGGKIVPHTSAEEIARRIGGNGRAPKWPL